jgi:vanillate O-demethylase ferredoxin subunit
VTARLIMKLDVVGVEDLGAQVRRIVLRHPRSPTLPAPEPGSHVDVDLGNGQVRQYSLCGDPADPTRYVIAVKLEPQGRGGSRWIHEHLRPGVQAHVSAPRNHFRLSAGARCHVLVAGGIGVTPLVAMARHLAQAGEALEMHYAAPDRSAAPFLAELEALLGPRLQPWLSKAPGGRRFDAARVLSGRDEGTHVYVCGPPTLVAAVRAATAGWAPSRVHAESFVPLADATPPQAFELQIRSTGQVLPVPAHRSALEVLREAGFIVASACRIGVCGACERPVAAGVVQHRDVVLDDAGRRRAMMTCVSRGQGRIVLDL